MFCGELLRLTKSSESAVDPSHHHFAPNRRSTRLVPPCHHPHESAPAARSKGVQRRRGRGARARVATSRRWGQASRNSSSPCATLSTSPRRGLRAPPGREAAAKGHRGRREGQGACSRGEQGSIRSSTRQFGLQIERFEAPIARAQGQRPSSLTLGDRPGARRKGEGEGPLQPAPRTATAATTGFLVSTLSYRTSTAATSGATACIRGPEA